MSSRLLSTGNKHVDRLRWGKVVIVLIFVLMVSVVHSSVAGVLAAKPSEINSYSISTVDIQSDNEPKFQLTAVGSDSDNLVVQEIKGAVTLEVANRPELIRPGHELYVIDSLRTNGNWAFFNLVSFPVDSEIELEQHIIPPDVLVGIAFKNSKQAWEVSLLMDSDFYQLLTNLPDSVLSQQSKIILQSSLTIDSTVIHTVHNVPGLPWPVNNAWRYNQNWHSGHEGFDFGTPTQGVSTMVHAADAGVVVYASETCLAVQRGGDNLQLWYQHIQSSDISAWQIGESVSFGQAIGMTTISDGCGGRSDGHHVHFFFKLPNQNLSSNVEGSTINGWTVVGEELHKNGIVAKPNFSDTVLHTGQGQNCSAPTLVEPANNAVRSERTLTFRWNAVSGCQFNGYTLRVCPTTNLDPQNVNECAVDTGAPGTEKEVTIPESFTNQTLYWSVRTSNPAGQWATPYRTLRIEPGSGDSEGVYLCRSTGSNFSDCPARFTGDAARLSDTPIGNDATNSIKIVGSWSAVLFEHDNYSGEKRSVFNGSDTNLSDNTIGTGSASSLRVRKRSPANFVLHDLGDCKGADFRSDRTIHDLNHWNFNDQAESICVANGFEAIVCSGAGFHGTCGRATGKVGDLNGIAPGLRGSVSSVQLCSGSCPPAPNAPTLNNPPNNDTVAPDSSITLRWSGNGQEYKIEYWGGNLSQPVEKDWSSETQWNIGTLPESSNPYRWRVKAWNQYGESSWSTEFTFIVQEVIQPPSAPTLYAIDNSDTDGNYIVNWSNVAGAISYEMQQRINGGSWATAYTGPATSVSIGGRADGEWCYRVRASNEAGNSNWSAIKCTIVDTPEPEDAPILDTIYNPNGEDYYIVEWTSIDGAIRYELQDQYGYDDDTWRTIHDGPETGVGIFEQQAGLWCYRVRAIHTNKTSDWSAQECTEVYLPTPTLYAIDNSDEDGNFLVEWSESFGATDYLLEAQFNEGEWSAAYDTNNTSYSATNKAVGEWCYRVSAWNYSTGAGSRTSNVRCTTVTNSGNGPTAPPSNLLATALSCTSIALEWGASAGAVTYAIYRDGLEIAVISSFNLSYVDDTVAGNSTYRYVVRAYDANINLSEPSNTAEVTTPNCGSNDDDSVPPTINWLQPAANGDTYTVYGETVLLRVQASDNVGVSRVRFRRWDAANNQWLELGNAFGSPFEINLATSPLATGWHEIEAIAYDAAGNTAQQSIFLYREGGSTNLSNQAFIPFVQR